MAEGGNLQQGPSKSSILGTDRLELTKGPPAFCWVLQNMLPDTCSHMLGWRDGVQVGLARLPHTLGLTLNLLQEVLFHAATL